MDDQFNLVYSYIKLIILVIFSALFQYQVYSYSINITTFVWYYSVYFIYKVLYKTMYYLILLRIIKLINQCGKMENIF